MDQNQLLKDGENGDLELRGRGDGGDEGDDDLEYDEAAIERRAAEFKSAVLDHIYKGSPLTLPHHNRIPLPPLPAWPSPIEEALGDMEDKALQVPRDLNKADTGVSMYPLHTSLLETGLGIDDTSQSFLDMLNADESTRSSLGEVELEDSNSISYKPKSPYTGKAEKESLEKSIREAEDLLSDASLNFSRLEPRLIEFKEAISKRDSIIKQLISSHEVVQKQLEEKEKELQQTHLMADELFKLKSTIQEFTESAESLRNVQHTDFSLPLDSTAESVPVHRPKKENADQVGHTIENEKPSPVPNHEEWCDLEDFKLKVADLEKKLEAKCKYIEELTVERETERDEFHRELENSDKKFAELKREKERLEEINAEHLSELNDYEERLKEADEVEQQLVEKSKHSEEELKMAVEKIYELREIIRDLEQQIDSASTKATELKEQNELLTDELDRLEHKGKDETLDTSQETLISAVPDGVIEEIQTQIYDLTSKLEKKLVEMDSCPWSTRPSSSCSGGQYMSSEDVSVKEMNNLSRTMQPATPFVIAESLCRLEAQFDNLMRFEELIMKKVKDNEIRYGNAKQRNEELENEKLALQETLKEQILKISDLQSRLDQFRFEPSPNALTLTGLRARVQMLSEQLEEYKGKLQLKMIENQDIEQKLASAQALLAKYTSQQQQVAAAAAAKKMECAIIQTDPVIILRQQPNKAKNVSVQTLTTGVQTDNPWVDSQPSESLPFSPDTHSTPNDPLVESRRKRTPMMWASKLERESPEVLRYREATEMPSTPTSSLDRLVETDMVKDNTQKELSIVVRKNQDLEQKLAFAQELIVKLQQATKVVKIGATQTEHMAFASQSAQTSQLDISTTIQKNAELQNELASARLLISKLQFQAPKNIATTQTDAIAIHSISAQTEITAKSPTKLHSQVQTESIKLTCGHENEIQTIQRKNRDLEHKLGLAHEAIIKLQQTRPKKAMLTQTDSKALTSLATQTDAPVEQAAVATKTSKPDQNTAPRPSFPLNFEVHSKSSISNDSWCVGDGDEEIHAVHRKHFATGVSYELYLRIKSHRKALCWQKRYLTQVVHGYKDLLIETGVGTQHPDYFKKQLSLVPGAIGVVDRRSPLIRFRIMVRVVIATTRMQRMVSRWTKRLRHHSFEGAKENSPPHTLHSLPSKHAVPIPPLKIPSGVGKTELRNVLTQHYERFKTLEDEIAHTMTNRLKRK